MEFDKTLFIMKLVYSTFGDVFHLSTLYFAPQRFGCVFEINFNNKLCALLSYSATRHGIVEKSSRNVKAEYILKACRSRGFPDFGRSVDPISIRGADYAHHITTWTPGFLDPPTALVW